MRSFSRWSLLLAIAFGSGLAQAQVYVEGGLFGGRVSGACDSSGKNCGDRIAGARATLGYQLGGGFGVDASWVQSAALDVFQDLRSQQLGASYRWPISSKVSLDLRGGAAFSQFKQAFDKKTSRGTSPYAGIGASYAFTPRQSAGLLLNTTQLKQLGRNRPLTSAELTWRGQF